MNIDEIYQDGKVVAKYLLKSKILVPVRELSKSVYIL